MIRISIAVIISFFLTLSATFAFDLEQAKTEYKGAQFKISSMKEGLYENAPAIVISFTAPLSKKRLKPHHATLNGGESDNWIISPNRMKLIFPFVEPETMYRVTVSSGIRDINGQKLGERHTKSIQTNKLTPGVNFASTGHILITSGPKYLPVTTLNIDEVDIDFFAIDEKNIPAFIQLLGSNGSQNHYRLNRIQDYGLLVHSGRFQLKPKKNQRTDYNIDLDVISALKNPGLYAAVLKKPGTYKYNYEFAYFMQTNTGLHIRKYTKTFDVYAQDITTGKPISDVRLDIVNMKGKILTTQTTGKNGKAGFHIAPEQQYIIATKNTRISILALHANALDLSGLKNAITSHSEYQIYPWGPRDLYRPSEKIKADILVRNYDGKLPPAMPLDYTFYKPDGSKVVSGSLQPEETGFYTFDYQTNGNSQTGRYHLKLSFGKTNTASYYVRVEEFLPERLSLTLFETEKDNRIITGNPGVISVPVTSAYLYGAPASGSKVDGFIAAGINPHPFDHLDTFYFGDETETIEYRRETFDAIKLSDTGAGTLAMKNKWSKLNSPVTLRVNASVYESGGRPVTRRSTVTLLNQDRYIGIEPQFEGKPDANSTVNVRLGCTDSTGKWQKNKTLDLTLIRKERNWYWRYDNSRGWHWAWDETPEVVFSKNIHLTEAKPVLEALPLTWGNYRLEVADGEALTAWEFETAWSWWGNAAGSASRKPDLISLGFEHAQYQPGQTAKLRINPPQDGLALVTVETSDGTLSTDFVPVKSTGTDIEIPTQSSWDRHDIYASVMVIRPGDMTQTPVPTRAFGMIHLPLKRKNTALTVTIDAPEKTEPGKKVTAVIKLASRTPLPDNTKVVVSLVDVGILNITRFKTPDAESYFFGPRRYNVDLYDNYGQVIDNIGPKTARQRFGGGFSESDANLARGGDKPKSDVMMVSFFSDPLTPDKDGRVEAGFDLPTFNGRLRWMVMAFTNDQFGHVETDTKVADKIVSQISMPRFLATGDMSTLALDLQNMSGTAQELSFKFITEGALAGTEHTALINLNDQEKRTFRFKVKALSASEAGRIHLTVTNSDKDIHIQRDWQLGVRSPYPSVTRKTVTRIAQGDSWQPDLKTSDLIPQATRYQLTVSPKPPIDFASHFNQLLHYPYGCLEQSISSGYPWVLATPKTVRDLGLTDQIKNRFNRDYDDTFRTVQINKAIGRVLDRQKTNGGFGLWSSGSPEEKWLSVYAAEFLNDANLAGGTVNSNALTKANRRLRDYLRGNIPKQYARWSADPAHYEFAFRSYAGYVLAKVGKASLSDLRRLAAAYQDKTNDDGLSWMMMAAAFKLTGDEKNATRCYLTALKEKKRDMDTYYGEYGSSLRDLAKMVTLMSKNGFDSTGEVIQALAIDIKNRRWLSTQERICLFSAALTIEKDLTENWNAMLVTDTANQPISRQKTFNTLFNDDQYQSLDEIQAISGPLYATLTLVGDRKSAPEPESNELAITRHYYDTNGQPLIPDQMKSGELAVVKLTVTASQRTPDGLVIDLLPAGVEIENQNLGATAVSLNKIQIDGKPIGETAAANRINHEEFRDDRYVAAVDLEKNQPVTLFYLIRAVTPGVYAVPPGYAEDMYRPYRFAIGKTTKTIEIFD